MLFVAMFIVGTIVATSILMAAIVLVGGEPATKDNFFKSLGLSIFGNTISLLPIFTFLQIPLYIGGLMIVFEKDLFEAFIIALVIFALNLVFFFMLAAILSAINLIPQDSETQPLEFDVPPPAMVQIVQRPSSILVQ